MTLLRSLVLAGAAAAIFTLSSQTASAQVGISIRVGTPPPPIVVERPWARPYAEAVWIPGHHEWVNSGWVWVGGYYAYPPHRGAHWVPARYHHGIYYPGHWD